MYINHSAKKLSILPVLLFAFGIGLMSCGQKQPESLSASMQLNIPKSDQTKEIDGRLLAQAAQFNMEGILLGKLATRRANSEEIIALAQMMEDSHREAKSAIASLAIYKGIAIPSEPTAANHDAYDKLNLNEVADFDLAYCNIIIDSDKDAIAKFESATQEHHDPDVEKIVLKLLPEMRAHLAKAKECRMHLRPIS
ncbi:MAG: DUF4142 domain-containing protein [Saprospiraceae bacterium]